MKTQYLLSLSLILLICVAGESYAAIRPRIVIGAQVLVAGDTLTLASISRIDGDDAKLVERLRHISLGYAPTFGTTRTIVRDEILSAVESIGIETDRIDLSMPPTVEVARAGQTVPAEQIQKSVESFVRERFAWATAEVTLQFPTQQEDVQVPRGQLMIRPSVPGVATPADRLFVNVSLEVDGHVAKYLSVEVNVEAVATVAVIAHNVERGDAVTVDDVRFERRQVGADMRRYFTSGRDLVGKQAAVSLQEGAVLQTSMLNDRMLIKRGDPVRIIAKAGALEIFATGEAKGGGRLGDRIDVINRSSGQIVVGEIIADKTVRVTF
ncbi:MAG TPA: flagellar basal body P-ring formation chaperone FlgA [Blastocatellia bacterium]|nr:flagellar basal body P-ring formation chaperone FlgA [Blastocatellia bacterium]